MKTINLFMAFLLMGLLTQAQTIITVDNNPGHNAQYSSVQDAIDNANAGDILYLQQGVESYGNFTVNKPLKIVGRSSADLSYRTIVANINLSIGSSGTTLEGMDISSINIGSNLDETNDLSVQDISILNNKIGQIFPGFGTDIDNNTPSPFINNILIRGNIVNNVFFDRRCFNVVVSNNIVSTVSAFQVNSTVITNNVFKIIGGTVLANNSNGGILNASNNAFITNSPSIVEVGLSGNYQLNNNLTFNYASGVSLPFGTNNFTVNNADDSLLDTDPQFTAVDPNNPASIANSSTFQFDPYSDNLLPAPGSPLLGGGFNGVDIGIYNGGFEFKPFGNAAGIPDVKIQGYSSTTPANGDIEVTIQAKTN